MDTYPAAPALLHKPVFAVCSTMTARTSYDAGALVPIQTVVILYSFVHGEPSGIFLK